MLNFSFCLFFLLSCETNHLLLHFSTAWGSGWSTKNQEILAWLPYHPLLAAAPQSFKALRAFCTLSCYCVDITHSHAIQQMWSYPVMKTKFFFRHCLAWWRVDQTSVSMRQPNFFGKPIHCSCNAVLHTSPDSITAVTAGGTCAVEADLACFSHSAWNVKVRTEMFLWPYFWPLKLLKPEHCFLAITNGQWCCLVSESKYQLFSTVKVQ